MKIISAKNLMKELCTIFIMSSAFALAHAFSFNYPDTEFGGNPYSVGRFFSHILDYFVVFSLVGLGCWLIEPLLLKKPCGDL